MLLAYEQFKACTQSHEAFASRYWPYAQVFLQQYEIMQNEKRVAAFLATIGVESQNLEKTEESLYYRDPLRLATIFKRAFDLNHDKVITSDEVEAAKAYCGQPELLAQKLYKGYPGAGLIQLTWLDNYQKYLQDTGVDVVSSPRLLTEPKDAFRSACWFWRKNGCNEAADIKDMSAVTRIVNGPALMALQERIERFKENLRFLKGSAI